MTAILTPTRTAAGYTATIDASDGTMTVHRVPIFTECERGDITFDADWIRAAVAKAKQAESDGYLPPLHIRHHEPSTEANDSVKAAGFFRILGAELITFKGTPRLAIFADLIITDAVTQDEILRKRYPYRSVEIFSVDKPAIDGLALLDHEAPFLELPMLMVSQVQALDSGSDVAGATFSKPWSMSVPGDGAAFSACFRRGRHAHLLFREETMSDDDKKKTDDDGEKMSDGGMDVTSIVKAIKDGSISVADMQLILGAIGEMDSEEDAPAADETAAPAAAPGQAMKNEKTDGMSEAMAAVKGENEALRMRVTAIEAETKRKEQVTSALQELEGRPLGADLKDRLIAFHRDNGEKPFLAFVDALAKNIPPSPDGDDPRRFTSVASETPEVAMKYQTLGTDAIDKAAKFAREWESLRGTGMKSSLENYVARNMSRLGLTLKNKTA